MIVQTFLEEDKQGLVFNEEENKEWLDKIEKLELEGQKSLINKEEGKPSPVPFRLLTLEWERCYKLICPDSCSVEKYSKETIPLKVLSVLALARENKYFGHIEVWFSKTNPDPVLVGYTPDKDGRCDAWYFGERYLLAQYGPENMTPELIKQRAKEIWIAKSKVQLEKAFSAAKHQLETIDSLADLHLHGESVNLAMSY